MTEKITPPKNSTEAYKLIHTEMAYWLQHGLNDGEAGQDFFINELRLAAAMRQIESHTDID